MNLAATTERWIDVPPRVYHSWGDVQEAVCLIEAEDPHKEVFSVLAHEVRTPLTIIIGYATLWLDRLAQGENGGELRRALRAIENQSRQLLCLVDIFQRSGGPGEWDMSPRHRSFEASGMIEEVLEDFAPLASTGGIALEAEAAREISLCVRIDPVLIRQVFHNLLINALKFTPKGGSIRLKVERQGGWAVFSVIDTGPGIPAEARWRIFDWSAQLKVRHNRAFPRGTGLGLAIAKKVVELHGGRIWVESALGHGTTFRFVLPLEGEGTR